MAAISEIRSIVQDLWAFFVPPIGRILVALLSLALIDGGGLLRKASDSANKLLDQVDKDALMSALTKFSLTSRVPVVGLFLFGFLVFGIDRFLQLLPNLIPVRFTYSAPDLYRLHGRLGAIWRQTPEAENAAQVLSILEQRLAAERLSGNKAALSNVDSWIDTYARYHNQQRFVRFLIAWTLIASVMVRALEGEGVLRMIAVVGILVLCL